MGRSAELHVVLGATGAVGSAVVRELLHRDHRVRAVHKESGRVPDACEQVRADLLSPWDARVACAGATVVYHCAQPDAANWHREFPAMTRSVLHTAGDAGAKVVFPDRLDAYGRVDGPVSEQTPERPAGAHGRVRAALVGMLLSAHRLGRTRVTIGRASDYYGPGGIASAAGAPLFEPALRGERARWFGSLDQPHSLHYLDDLARGLVTLGEHDKADGAVWHLPASEAVTGWEFLGIVFGQLGLVPQVSVVSQGHVTLRGMSLRRMGDLRETLVRFSVPFVVDTAAFERTFGPLATTSHEEGVAETLAWFRMHRG
jgi:nucleoside-diphosphate-sugar epimerase